MKILVLDGSPQECADFLSLHESKTSETVCAEAQTTDGGGYIEFLRRLLKPQTLSEKVRNYLQALYSEPQESLTNTQIAIRLGITEREAGSRVGQLGRVVNKTSGAQEIAALLAKQGEINAQKWPSASVVEMRLNKVDKKWHYRLYPEVRQILEENGIVDSMDVDQPA